MKGLIYIGIMLVLCTNVLALGIASDYVEDGILWMNKGETKTYGIRIQNVEDRNVTVKVTSNLPIINQKDTYFLPAHTTKNAIQWEVKLPDKTKEMPLTWTVTEIGSSTGGQVQTSKSINGGIVIKQKEGIQWYQQYWQAITAFVVLAGWGLYNIIKKKEVKKENEKVM